jgi:hypothetical protein
MSDSLKLAYRRALSSGDPSLLQLSFEAAVIDRYRGMPDVQVIRTNTVGRVRKQGGWAIDVGIAPGEQVVHCAWSAIALLPQEEREHWAMHATAAAELSEMFLRMLLAPGSCFDDGDLRAW